MYNIENVQKFQETKHQLVKQFVSSKLELSISGDAISMYYARG